MSYMAQKSLLREHLEQAERHVAQGEQHIRSQKARIVDLERDGRDTTQARQVLKTFEDSQKMHVADRDRARQEVIQDLDPREE